MKKFLEEFKAFALKGNMMDMAIGVLIGGAFSTLVTSLTDNIINPIIGILFQTDFSDVVLHLPFDINLGIGAFISAVINFIILAFVLFWDAVRPRAAYMPPLQSGRKSTQLNFIKFSHCKTKQIRFLR